MTESWAMDTTPPERPSELPLLDRELSWLAFNERVLEEAQCPDTPVLERLAFLSIFTSNLDEFFMVRVGGMLDGLRRCPRRQDDHGKPLADRLSAVLRAIRPLYARRDEVFDALCPLLARHGLYRTEPRHLDGREKKKLDFFFQTRMRPLLSPQIMDDKLPFPHVESKTLMLAVALAAKDMPVFGLVALPAAVDRLFFTDASCLKYVLAEDILLHYAEVVFHPFKVREKAVLCVTRSLDALANGLYREDGEDSRRHIQKLLKNRKRLSPVRLEAQGALSSALTAFLLKKLCLTKRQLFISQSPLDLRYCYALKEKLPVHMRERLCFPPLPPAKAQLGNCISRVKRGDVLLAYPFESMDFFIALIREAAHDPAVVSIHITLYRLARQSKLAGHLMTAAENGKEVTAFIELRARMDEENNIEWARRLEEAGCRVRYGPDSFKIHAKLCLITRRERGRLTYITAVGTGNFNEITARLYTDLTLITAHPQIGADSARFFHGLLAGRFSFAYHHFWAAPYGFKQALLAAIYGQAAKADRGQPARIRIKCNALTDKDVIAALVYASRHGVRINLYIRGICRLRPHVPCQTDNITVKSIVGRFLEHSRIYCFGEGGEASLYIGSADMMTRNTQRRLEILTPVLDTEIKERLLRMLAVMGSDTVKSRDLLADGVYHRADGAGRPRIDSQQFFIENPQARITGAPLQRDDRFSRRHFGRKDEYTHF